MVGGAYKAPLIAWRRRPALCGRWSTVQPFDFICEKSERKEYLFLPGGPLTGLEEILDRFPVREAAALPNLERGDRHLQLRHRALRLSKRSPRGCDWPPRCEAELGRSDLRDEVVGAEAVVVPELEDQLGVLRGAAVVRLLRVLCVRGANSTRKKRRQHRFFRSVPCAKRPRCNVPCATSSKV